MLLHLIFTVTLSGETLSQYPFTDGEIEAQEGLLNLHWITLAVGVVQTPSEFVLFHFLTFYFKVS